MIIFDYKGYRGGAEYEVEDELYFGEVLGLKKGVCITYQGATIEELKQDFEEGVDAYLSSCEANGFEPSKPFYQPLNAEIESDIYNLIEMTAQKNGTSFNSVVRESLERGLLQIA
jgi:predicted HicB family RNase H-like nuclease